MKMQTLVVSLLSSIAVFAADTKERIDAPMTGFSYSGGELRAMLGVPGAARWSDAVRLPEGTASVRLAPGHRFALLQLENGEAGVLDLEGFGYRAIGPVSLDGLTFSPTGAFAAVSGALLSGLPANPEVLAIPAQDGRMAVSDTGTMAVATGGKLLRGGAQLLDCSGCAFAFALRSETMVVVADGKLMEISESGARREIASGVRAEFLQADANSVVAATSETVAAWDRASGLVVRAEESATVTKLEAGRLGGSYILSDDEGAPVWMFTMSDGVRLAPVRNGGAKE